MRGLLNITLLAIAAPGAAIADPLQFSGSVGLETAHFTQQGLFPGQTEQSQLGVSAEIGLRWVSDDRRTRFQFTGFGRLDNVDDSRSHVDVTEAYLAHRFGSVDVLAGVNKVFWGVTESRRLVDIINQIDNLEFANRDARLGQPMVMVGLQTGVGHFSAFVLPGFRERAYAGTSGRFGFGLPVDETSATFANPDGADAVDFALRYTGNFGPVDIGLSWFHGASREPTLAPNGAGTALVPHYAAIEQVGLDLQYTNDALLLKLEAIQRRGEGKDFVAAVAGLEYTFYQVFGTNGDLGVIAEYLYDGRDSTAPVTIFQDDVFVGARWAANDTQDTSLLFGVLLDQEHGTKIARAEFERRMGDSISLEISGNATIDAGAADPASVFRNDDFVQVGVSYHF